MAIQWFEVRDARLLSGLTQSQLADRMGVSVRSVNSYEKPDSVIPRKAEHGIRSVLAEELVRLERIHKEQGYTSSATSDLADFVSLPEAPAYVRNPRLAGIATSELLRELLARDEEQTTFADTYEEPFKNNVTPIVGGYSDDELSDIAERAESGHLPAAAGTDETAPREDD